MNNRVKQVINNDFDNYLFPFMWIKNGERDSIVSQIDDIFNMGHRALCIESRTHEDFCGDEWWRDVRVVLEECKKRNMTVWLLDGKRFPTGYINENAFINQPHLKARTLIERCIDIAGPINDNQLLVMYDDPNDKLLGVWAYKTVNGIADIENAVCLDRQVRKNRVSVSLPEGKWRVCFYFSSEQFSRENYISMVDGDSCKLLIKEIYEPHYKHFGQYFGNTFAGFFSDEPSFGNEFYENALSFGNPYERKIGTPGLALPYSDELLLMLKEVLGDDAIKYFYSLWYTSTDYKNARYIYMDCATKLYQKNFSNMIGDWCRKHNVGYIGHVIEDNGCHTKLSYGAGHYFRAVDGQSMGGVDVVLHQIQPGLTDGNHTIGFGKFGDSRFFTYGLAKLASSIAHINPVMNNNSVCEIFGAYGWGEHTHLMKWLVDFMLVRGINHFVPHAFCAEQWNPDSPPHFNIKCNPQRNGYKVLADYMNKMCHILNGTNRVCDAAILYHAECEWYNGECMPCEVPAKELFDNLMDYDFVSLDYLYNATVDNGILTVNECTYSCLIVPYAKCYPDKMKSVIGRLYKLGAKVIFIEQKPEDIDADTVCIKNLADYCIKNGYNGFKAVCNNKYLRACRFCSDNDETVFLFNESVSKDAKIKIPVCNKTANVVDLINESYYSLTPNNGEIELSLSPYQSVLLSLDGTTEFKTDDYKLIKTVGIDTFNIELYDTVLQKNIACYIDAKEPIDFQNPDLFPDFAGKIKYSAGFELSGDFDKAILNIAADGQTAEISVNGSKSITRICKPMLFDITEFLHTGKNHIFISLCNTLAGKTNEHHTRLLPILPAGLNSAVEIKLYNSQNKTL